MPYTTYLLVIIFALASHTHNTYSLGCLLRTGSFLQLPLSSLEKGAGSSSGRGSSAGSGAGKAVGFALPNDDDAQGGKGSSGGRGSKATLAEQLKALTKAMERHEAKNVPLFLATAQVVTPAVAAVFLSIKKIISRSIFIIVCCVSSFALLCHRLYSLSCLRARRWSPAT